MAFVGTLLVVHFQKTCDMSKTCAKCVLGGGLDDTKSFVCQGWRLYISVGQQITKIKVRKITSIIYKCKIDQVYVPGPSGILRALKDGAPNHYSCESQVPNTSPVLGCIGFPTFASHPTPLHFGFRASATFGSWHLVRPSNQKVILPS